MTRDNDDKHRPGSGTTTHSDEEVTLCKEKIPEDEAALK